MNRRTDPEGVDFRGDRNHYCAQEERLSEIDKDLNGNGKPGLKADMERVVLALYGSPENQMPGMIEKQQEILAFIKPLKPFLNTKLLAAVFTLSVLACLKVLGTDLIMDIVKRFMH